MSGLQLDSEQVNTLVKRVLNRLEADGAPSAGRPLVPSPHLPIQKNAPDFSSRGIFSDLNAAVKAAKTAYPVWSGLRLDHRKLIIEKMRARLRECLQWMSEEAVSETGLGRADDKIK